ncbi:MAG TPA: BrnT family toxin [Gammaproteobacteria bacterium]|nr:BrnT family toxin [Gammaproteobacteria bacterium]HQZ87430.1 BrnT family toxin [Gammaproteobacteria bacterium]HRA42588.1 BrnT family toxin [Gammaproteobacteria bacterium]
MKIDFDPEKSNKNIRERGLAFELIVEFDWETAIYAEDIRSLYAERRFITIGYIGQRLHVVCFTPIKGGIRAISFRKANLREVKRYEKETINQ